MGNAIARLIDNFGALRYGDLSAREFQFTVGQLKGHLRENANVIRRYSALDARPDVYTGDNVLRLESGRIIFSDEREYVKWVFVPESTLALFYAATDPQANDLFIGEFLNKQQQELAEGVGIAPLRILEETDRANYTVAMGDEENYGIYISVLFSDNNKNPRNLYIRTNQPSKFNVGTIPIFDAVYEKTTLTQVFKLEDDAFLYLGPIYQIVANQRRFVDGYRRAVPFTLQAASYFRIPFQLSEGRREVALNSLVRDGDALNTLEYRDSMEIMTQALGLSKLEPGQDPFEAVLGYRGELHFQGAKTILQPLAPLLPVHTATTLRELFTLTREAQGLGLRLGDAPGGRVRLAWYRSDEVAKDEFLGYHPLPSPVYLAERTRIVNVAVEDAYDTQVARGFMDGKDHLVYSLWVFVFVNNIEVLEDVPVYTRRCIQHIHVPVATILQSVQMVREVLNASSPAARRHTLPQHIDRDIAENAYPPALFGGYTSTLDWTLSLARRTAPEPDDPEPLYDAMRGEYRSGTFVGKAYSVPRFSVDRGVAEVLIESTLPFRFVPVDPLMRGERIQTSDVTYAIRYLRRISMSRAIAALQQRASEYAGPARLRALLQGLFDQQEVDPRTTYITQVPDSVAQSQLIEQVKALEGGPDSDQIPVILNQAFILPVGQAGGGSPDKAVAKYLRNVDQAIGSTLGRIALEFANPYYMPYLYKAIQAQVLFGPTELFDNAVRTFSRATLSSSELITIPNGGGGQGVAQAPYMVLHRYLQWRNRYAPEEAYPSWFRLRGKSLVYDTYHFRTVRWRAIDGRTKAPYDVANPPAWGSLLWRQATGLGEHPLVREMRHLYDRICRTHGLPLQVFLDRAARALFEYERKGPNGDGDVDGDGTMPVTEHLHATIQNLRQAQREVIDELADSTPAEELRRTLQHQQRRRGHTSGRLALLDTDRGGVGVHRDMARQYVSSLTVAQLQRLMTRLGIRIRGGTAITPGCNVPPLGRYLETQLLRPHPADVHIKTKGVWMGAYRADATRPRLINTVERVVPLLQLISGAPDEVYEELVRTFTSFTYDTSDIFVPAPNSLPAPGVVWL